MRCARSPTRVKSILAILDALIHLAGEPISALWTKIANAASSSRVDLTSDLVEAIAAITAVVVGVFDVRLGHRILRRSCR